MKSLRHWLRQPKAENATLPRANATVAYRKATLDDKTATAARPSRSGETSRCSGTTEGDLAERKRNHRFVPTSGVRLATILVSVRDRQVVLAISRAVQEQLHEVRPVTPSWFSAPVLGSPRNNAVLVYDFSPHDAGGPQNVRRVRLAHPDMPILIWPPQDFGAGDSIFACGQVGGIRLFIQSGGGSTQRFGEFLKDVISSQPSDVLLRLMRLLLEGNAPAVLAYTQAIVDSIGQRTADTAPATLIARRMDMTIRSLERQMRTLGLPGPKEFLDTLLCLWILSAASFGRVSIRKAAGTIHISPRRVRRMMKIVLPLAATGATVEQLFDLTFLSLAKRCDIPVARVTEVLATRTA